MADQLIALLSDLVAIDSVNTSMDPAGGGEAALADYVAGRCRDLGLSVELHDALPGRPNVLAKLEVPGARGNLLFNAHSDTVPAGDMLQAFTPRVENGRLYGRGSADDKGPLAAMLLSLERLLARRDELHCNVTFAVTSDEESGSTGAEFLAAMPLRFDGGVIAEGTDNQAVIAEPGGARVRVRVRGRSAHSSRPERGENAIVRAAEVVRFIDEVYAPRVAQRRHPLFGSAAVAVTIIQGGVATNVIPPECTLTIKRRALPSETHESLHAEFEAALDELRQAHPELKIDPIVTDLWDGGLDTPPEAPVAQAALQAVRAVLGQGEFGGVPWGSDASTFFNLNGLPCVILGPDSVVEQGHTANESISLEAAAQAVRIYEELAIRFGEAL